VKLPKEKEEVRVLGKQLLPAVPSQRLRGGNEMKEAEAFIRSAGGKPLTQARKRRIEKADCIGFPQD